MSAAEANNDSNEQVGQELLSALVQNWRGMRQNSIGLAARAESAEQLVCDSVDTFQHGHDRYANMQRELQTVPVIADQVARLTQGVHGIIDKVTRLEIALDLAIKQHNESIVAQARADADATLTRTRVRLHHDFTEARRTMQAARQKHVETVLKAHRAKVQAELDSAMTNFVRSQSQFTAASGTAPTGAASPAPAPAPAPASGPAAAAAAVSSSSVAAADAGAHAKAQAQARTQAEKARLDSFYSDVQALSPVPAGGRTSSLTGGGSGDGGSEDQLNARASSKVKAVQSAAPESDDELP
jgi:hypothetical protein